jgi:hypothetical protein
MWLRMWRITSCPIIYAYQSVYKGVVDAGPLTSFLMGASANYMLYSSDVNVATYTIAGIIPSNKEVAL